MFIEMDKYTNVITPRWKNYYYLKYVIWVILKFDFIIGSVYTVVSVINEEPVDNPLSNLLLWL